MENQTNNDDTVSLLAEIFPAEPVERLADTLVDCGGDLERAIERLTADHSPKQPTAASLDFEMDPNGPKPCNVPYGSVFTPWNRQSLKFPSRVQHESSFPSLAAAETAPSVPRVATNKRKFPSSISPQRGASPVKEQPKKRKHKRQATGKEPFQVVSRPKRRPSKRPPEEKSFTVDLHGLCVRDALDLVKSLIQRSSRTPPVHLEIITGVGKHSEGGKPRIKIALSQMFANTPLQWAENRPGVIEVDVR